MRRKGFVLLFIVIMLAFTTLFACGDRAEKYTVEFNSSGGNTVASQSVERGGKVTKPIDPIKASTEQLDYTFEGWFTSIEYLKEYDFNSLVVTENITLYAKFTANYKLITYTLNNDGQSYSITGVKNANIIENIIIPPSYNQKAVTSIGAAALEDCTALTSIIIPSSVTSIGSGAFKGCSRLKIITLPFVGEILDGTSNTNLGYIFGGNNSYVPTSLKTVIITGGTSIAGGTSFGYSAFYGCSSLTSITLPSSLTSIGRSAFYGCTGLTNIALPSSVTSIERSAFSGCTGLTSVVMSNSTTNIGDYAFNGCKSLTNIALPSGVISIGEYAFSGCSSLTNITIPSSVTSIGEYAFSGHSKQASIYCEAEKQPATWKSGWKSNCTATVIWGYTG